MNKVFHLTHGIILCVLSIGITWHQILKEEKGNHARKDFIGDFVFILFFSITRKQKKIQVSHFFIGGISSRLLLPGFLWALIATYSPFRRAQ